MKANTPKHYLSYWSEASCNAAAYDGVLNHGASGQYGIVCPGDVVWIFTFRSVPGRNDGTPGRPHLIGQIPVRHVVSRSEAARLLGKSSGDLWPAKFHIVAGPHRASRAVDIDLTALELPLEFLSNRGRSYFPLQALPQSAIRVFNCLYDNAQPDHGGGGGRPFSATETARAQNVLQSWIDSPEDCLAELSLENDDEPEWDNDYDC